MYFQLAKELKSYDPSIRPLSRVSQAGLGSCVDLEPSHKYRGPPLRTRALHQEKAKELLQRGTTEPGEDTAWTFKGSSFVVGFYTNTYYMDALAPPFLLF